MGFTPLSVKEKYWGIETKYRSKLHNLYARWSWPCSYSEWEGRVQFFHFGEGNKQLLDPSDWGLSPARTKFKASMTNPSIHWCLLLGESGEDPIHITTDSTKIGRFHQHLSNVYVLNFFKLATNWNFPLTSPVLITFWVLQRSRQ